MPVTYLIKLSLTVDFILVNKGQHDPVADNGTLGGGGKNGQGELIVQMVIRVILKPSN